ncbi:MAG: DUF3224 domain-containing protein [Nocardioides sp.]
MNFTRTATCRFTVASWSEELVVDIDGEDQGTRAGDLYYPHRGFTRADCGYAYSGDLDATSTLTYLIAYKPEGAPVIGFEQVVGTLDGHDGSFVFRHTGWQDAGSVRASLAVVEGLGTGGLESLRGTAELEIAGHSDDGYALELHYDLD